MRDLPAVRRPCVAGDAFLRLGELPCFAAVGTHQPDLFLRPFGVTGGRRGGGGRAARGGKTDVASVRRPRWRRLSLVLVAGRELARRVAGGRRDAPNVRRRRREWR